MKIEAVAFDCYGTIVDFSDDHFARAYEEICREQGIDIEGKVFYEKWMEVWRRLASDGRTSDAGTVAVTPVVAATAEAPNAPGPLSEAEAIPPHPEHHTPSAGRTRTLNGPVPPFRPYSEEWPEHFAICFEELGLKGDPTRAYQRLVEMLGNAEAFPEARGVVEAVSRRVPVGLLSNADDNFLRPALARNGFRFPVVVSSESARAYKPHVAIFEGLSRELGLPPETILYVGDSRFADIAGAKNAGMLAAWINRKGRRPLEAAGRADGETLAQGQRAQRDLPPPDFEIDTLEALLEIVR
ncbi:MAG TPA: HAD family hydrolase [Dehalococcoidia bacterium]|nr:HAD family hydrolase [Dehalococcoidia bacterium]